MVSPEDPDSSVQDTYEYYFHHFKNFAITFILSRAGTEELSDIFCSWPPQHLVSLVLVFSKITLLTYGGKILGTIFLWVHLVHRPHRFFVTLSFHLQTDCAYRSPPPTSHPPNNRSTLARTAMQQIGRSPPPLCRPTNPEHFNWK